MSNQVKHVSNTLQKIHRLTTPQTRRNPAPMKRILIAGFQHETNTFGATQATMADFEMADSWPGLLRGDDVIVGTKGCALPLAGFVQAARQITEFELVPILWAAAEPSAHVTDHAYETIAGAILRGVTDAGRIDGIYLDLHGAMVTETHQDGEGELLRRLRSQVGPDLPIVISLDLHANVTRSMVTHASAITMFRTYPHLDMAQTGRRAADILAALIRGTRIAAAFRQAPFLIPLSSQYTGGAPFDQLYAACQSIGPDPYQWVELAAGFPAADIFDAGPSVLAYAESQAQADHIADTLLADLVGAEMNIRTDLLDPDEAVAHAMAAHASTKRPIVIADVQDNPGGGGTSDTTGLLRALIDGRAQGAVLGLLNDPEIAASAHAQGVGAEFQADLGGKAGQTPTPYRAHYRVEALTDGIFAYQGDMYAGLTADTGPGAVLRVMHQHADVRVVVSSKRCQNLDLTCFTQAGIDPAAQAILVVKSTVHFRADYAPIAGRILSAAAPGLLPCRLDTVPYRNLRPGVRLMPRAG